MRMTPDMKIGLGDVYFFAGEKVRKEIDRRRIFEQLNGVRAYGHSR